MGFREQLQQIERENRQRMNDLILEEARKQEELKKQIEKAREDEKAATQERMAEERKQNILAALKAGRLIKSLRKEANAIVAMQEAERQRLEQADDMWGDLDFTTDGTEWDDIPEERIVEAPLEPESVNSDDLTELTELTELTTQEEPIMCETEIIEEVIEPTPTLEQAEKPKRQRCMMSECPKQVTIKVPADLVEWCSFKRSRGYNLPACFLSIIRDYLASGKDLEWDAKKVKNN